MNVYIANIFLICHLEQFCDTSEVIRVTFQSCLETGFSVLQWQQQLRWATFLQVSGCLSSKICQQNG